MTSREALQELKKLIPFKEELTDKVLECENIIEQDLKKLENLNKIFGDSHISEIEAKFNEIKCSSDLCENCPLGIGDSICLKIIFETKWKLQKKEAPMKPIANHYEEIGEKPYIKYSCPKCNNKYQLIKNLGKYCPYCGQRLDWSECNG